MSKPSAPLRILHVMFSLEPGGMENGVVNLTRAMAPEQFDVRLCCLERGGEFVERLPKPEHVTVLGKPSGFSLATVRKLRRVILELKPDVIHSHNFGPLSYAFLASLFGRTRPLLHGEHSLLTEAECVPKRLKLRRWFYGGCHRVHTVSEGLRQQLIDLGFPAEKIVTLLNGVDVEKFSPGNRQAARRGLGLPEDGFYVGIVGRFGPFKRHDALIEAFNRLAGKFPRLRLLVVGGTGPERSRIEGLVAASPAAGRIHLAGFQNRLTPYYQAMDLLAVPSVNEGLSNAVLEAMACATPAVANNTCGNGEVIVSGTSGVVADLGTPEKIAGELEKMLVAEEFLSKMAASARASVVRDFSITRMVENYQQLYRQTAARA